MKVFLKGLNTCSMRRQKLQQYRDFLVANGHEISSDPHNSDVILMWTCAFRADVRDNSISEIRRYQREYNGELIVGGCLPDIDPELLKKNFAGRILYWRGDNHLMEQFFGCDKLRFDQVPLIFIEKNLCDDAQKYREENPDKDAMFPDQFLKLLVSEGCNFECAYCSERLAFPPFRSFPEDELVEACRRMVEETGKLEVVLLADNLGAYGADMGSSFPALIRKLKTIHPSLRFALCNFNLAYFVQYYDDMAEFLRNGDFVHLNLPIQSASDRILKLMNRPYTRSDIEKVFGLLNDIGFKEFDTHIIIGFPGETEADYEETIQSILRYKPKYVLASNYMEVPRMASSRLPDKVDWGTISRLARNTVERMKAADILCNSDESDLMESRFRRISLNE